MQIRLHSGRMRYLIFTNELDARWLEAAIDRANATAAGVDLVPSFDDAPDKAKWWRETLGALATAAARRGDASLVAKLAQSATGFENVAKLKGLVTKLMAHIEMLQAGKVRGKRTGAA